MGSFGGLQILLVVTFLLALILNADCQGTTWFWYFTSTSGPLDWDKFMATFGTFPGSNGTTGLPWWALTTSTLPPTTSTIPTTMSLDTTPQFQTVEESSDTMFLVIIIVACVVGLAIAGVLVCIICKMMKSKKHKKTKRLRVKPLKADQVFAPVIHPGMGMGMDMGMGMGMGMAPDPMGGMPGMMPPMDTGMMGMPGAMPGMDQGMPGMPPMDPSMMGGEKQWFG